MKTFRLPVGFALLSMLAAGPALADASGSPLVDHVRAANDRFKDVAVAVAEGYGPIPCASSAQGGAMAFTMSTAIFSRMASPTSQNRKR